MTLSRTLERLERFGDSEADRALRPPVTDLPPDPHERDPRDPRDRRPVQRSWRRPVLLGATIFLAVVVVIGYLVGWSPLLGASTVQVDGTTTLTAAQVREAAGVADGSPLVRLDTTAVERRVEQLPQVASARVAVSYPSTVVVTVVERTAVLQLGAPLRLVDATGAVFAAPAGGAAPTGLPVTSATGAGLTAAATVAAAIPARARALVSRVDVAPAAASTPAAVTVILADGRTVVWGGTDRSTEKGQILAALIAPGAGAPPAVAGDTIDVTDPGVVVSR